MRFLSERERKGAQKKLTFKVNWVQKMSHQSSTLPEEIGLAFCCEMTEIATWGFAADTRLLNL